MQIQPLTHCQDAQDCICYNKSLKGQPMYVIRLYHRQQLFPMAEKQFLNQDHHKVHDSEDKPCHMPRYSPITAKK